MLQYEERSLGGGSRIQSIDYDALNAISSHGLGIRSQDTSDRFGGCLIERYDRFLTHQYQFWEAVLPLWLDRLCGVIDRQTLIKSFSLNFFRLLCFCSVPLYLWAMTEKFLLALPSLPRVGW